MKKTNNSRFGAEATWENELGGKPMKVLAMFEDNTPLTPTTFEFTQTAMIIFAYKPSGQIEGIHGGTQPLYTNNINELWVVDENNCLELGTTLSEDGKYISVVLNRKGLSYSRVMVVDMPIELPF